MLKIEGLCFSYQKDLPVLRDFNLELGQGEFLSVMGASGCGKSTLLSLIAGLLKPSSGSIRSQFQRIAYVFQEPRLFPWLTVEQNLAAVLSEKQDRERIPEVLRTVGLQGAENMYPDELSGGMKTRASLARALLYGGDLFLLDEPFAALDEALRLELVEHLREYFTKNGISAILVSHQREISEAFSNRILEMSPN